MKPYTFIDMIFGEGKDRKPVVIAWIVVGLICLARILIKEFIGK